MGTRWSGGLTKYNCECGNCGWKGVRSMKGMYRKCPKCKISGMIESVGEVGDRFVVAKSLLKTLE